MNILLAICWFISGAAFEYAGFPIMMAVCFALTAFHFAVEVYDGVCKDRAKRKEGQP